MCPHPMYITQLPPTPPFCWGCYRCQSSPAAFHHAWCMEVLVSSVKSQCPSSSVCLFFYPCWATAPSFWSLCGRSQFCDTFCFLPSPQYALEQLSSCIVVYMSAFGIAVFSLWHWLSPCIHTHAVWEPEAPVFVVLKWNNVSDSHPIPSFCVIAHLHYFCCFDVSSRHWHTFHGRGWAIG